MTKIVLIITSVLDALFLAEAACNLGVYESGVNDADQNSIVTKHNDLRVLLARGMVPGQPKATNILRLEYDERLAQAAQNIANTCIYAHAAVNDSRWNWVGQNIYTYYSTVFAKGASWNSVIQSWFDEYKTYHYPDDSTRETGHYTQIAWATTKYVGCGYSYYPSGGHYPHTKFYVCNYGPGGNIRGMAPYKTGASGCDNLC